MGQPGLLVYDGDCGFCSWCVRVVEARLPPDFTAVPWQRCDLDSLGLSEDDVRSAAYLRTPDGRMHRGHIAVARTLELCGGWRRALGRVLSWPVVSSMAAVVYRLVAENRHRLRWPGATASCTTEPSPKV